MAKAAKAEEFRNEITSKIIAAFENGTAPWQKPWNGAEAPYNAITKHQYNGINSVILSMAAMSMNAAKTDSSQNSLKSDGVDRNNNTVGTDSIANINSTKNADLTDLTDNAMHASQRADQRFATYLQISNAGWHVREGEKGTHVTLEAEPNCKRRWRHGNNFCNAKSFHSLSQVRLREYPSTFRRKSISSRRTRKPRKSYFPAESEFFSAAVKLSTVRAEITFKFRTGAILRAGKPSILQFCMS